MRGRKRIEWAGTTQGKLTIIEEVGRDPHGNVLWRCICECGVVCEKANRSLAGGVKSCSPACGVSASNTARAIHGMWKSKEYQTWASMKQRCTNPNSMHYPTYGGRGITVHPAWIDNFEQFLVDVGRAPETALSLDRINNDGNYEPGNVRWATRKEQSNNRRETISAEIEGRTLPLADLAREYGVAYMLVFQRYKRGLRGADLVTNHKVGRKPGKKLGTP
jgi:hypothetical protein